jgi:hypothetical protein
MDRLPLLTLLFLVAKYSRPLVPLPDWTSSGNVREWARKLITALTALSQQTATAIDDTALQTAGNLVTSDEAWSLFWRAMQGISVCRKDDSHPMASGQVAMDDIAEKAGISPATVVLIVQAIMAVVELVKNHWSSSRSIMPMQPSRSLAT